MSAARVPSTETSEPRPLPASEFELFAAADGLPSSAEPGRVLAGTGQRPDVDSFASVLARLVSSAEPAVVLTSLVGLCVPAFSDECCIAVAEDGQRCYGICSPDREPSPANVAIVRRWLTGVDPSAQQVGIHMLRTTIVAPAEFGDPGYRAVLVHRWQQYQPTAADAALALLMLDRTVGTIRRERLTHQLQQHQRTAENLQYALLSSREIGAAIGILMATRQITNPQAFDLLLSASQHRHLKLRAIAAEVVFTGALDPPRSSHRCSANTPPPHADRQQVEQMSL